MTADVGNSPGSQKQPRVRGWRFFVQFSLRTLLMVTTLAAVACWWFLQPQTRDEELASKHLKLRRQVQLRKLRPNERVMPSKELQFVWIDGLVLLNVGSWRLSDQHGDLLVSGRYENHQPHGKWTVYHISGRKAAEGEMFRGARTGMWRVWDEEGGLASEVMYQAKGETVRLGGTMSTGLAPLRQPVVSNLYRTIRHGPARAWYLSGQLKLEGQYKDDRRDGLWTYYDEQGRITAKGEYRDGKRAGEWTVADPTTAAPGVRRGTREGEAPAEPRIPGP